MAVLCGKTPKKDILVDKLLKNPKTNTTVVSEKGKEAILSYELIKYKNNYSLVKINLETGRSHQIRVQFSSRGYPCMVIKDIIKKHYQNNKLLYLPID